MIFFVHQMISISGRLLGNSPEDRLEEGMRRDKSDIGSKACLKILDQGGQKYRNQETFGSWQPNYFKKETSQTWGARPAWRFRILVGKTISTKNYPLISLTNYLEIQLEEWMRWDPTLVETSQTWGARTAWRFWTQVGKNFNQEMLESWRAKYFKYETHRDKSDMGSKGLLEDFEPW